MFVAYHDVMQQRLVGVSDAIKKVTDFNAAVTLHKESFLQASGNIALSGNLTPSGTTVQGWSQQALGVPVQGYTQQGLAQVQGRPQQSCSQAAHGSSQSHGGQTRGLPQQIPSRAQGMPQQSPGYVQGLAQQAQGHMQASTQGQPQQPPHIQGFTHQTSAPSQEWPQQQHATQIPQLYSAAPSIHDAVAASLQQYRGVLDAETDTVLRQQLPKLPPYQNVIYIGSNVHQQDFPMGHLVFHTCD